MKKLNIYITKQIIIGFLLVSFSLMSIIWLSQSLRFLDLIASDGISFATFVELTSLLMPRIFTILAPISLFAAVLFVYNRMLADQELVVMKSAGISPWQLAKPALFVGILLALSNVYVMNIGIPKAEDTFNDLQWKVKNKLSHMMFREGEFKTVQHGLTVFVASHEDDGTVGGVLINDERNPNQTSTISAEKGVIIQGEKGAHIILANGNRQEIDNKSGRFSSVSFKKYSMDFGLSSTKARRQNSVRVRSFRELITALQDSSIPENERAKWFVEGNKRILTPLLSLVYALIACTGLLISNFNRRGQTKTIGLSLTAVIIIQALDLISSNQAAKKLIWLVLTYANIIIPFTVCILMLLNIFNKRRHPQNPFDEGDCHA
jgi:lipopolysaccharide export system permease protein